MCPLTPLVVPTGRYPLKCRDGSGLSHPGREVTLWKRENKTRGGGSVSEEEAAIPRVAEKGVRVGGLGLPGGRGLRVAVR